MKLFGKILTVLLVAASAMAILGGAAFIGVFGYYYMVGQQVYENLTQEIVDHGTGSEPFLPADGPEIDFEALREINPDIAAWIRIPDTKIDYPVVWRENDNDFYLSHLFDGTPNRSGCIFMDTRCNLKDSHVLIHGHNMGNGTMFRDLNLFKNPQFLLEHPVFYLYTPDEVYTVEIFAGSIVRIDSPVWQLDFSGKEDIVQWQSYCVDNASVRTGTRPDADDVVITLSTCTYEYRQARWILQGVLRPA